MIYGASRYAHMCRDNHVQIGHNDSENERCPLCRALDELEFLRVKIRLMVRESEIRYPERDA